MVKKLFGYEIWGTIFVWIAGTLLHFAYGWSGNNAFVGFFVPVNESVFEHLKLLFFPYALYAAFEYWRIGIRYRNFLFIKAISVLAGILFIPLSFWGYTAILQADFLVLDIGIFVISVALSFAVSYALLKRRAFCRYDLNAYGIFVFAFITLLFILFTLFPRQDLIW